MCVERERNGHTLLETIKLRLRENRVNKEGKKWGGPSKNAQ